MIKKRKITEKEIQEKGILEWPIWEKEVSNFDWKYDDVENCYIIAGEVVIKTQDQEIKLEIGDFCEFPKDLCCHWDIIKPIKKHYTFLY